MTLLDVFMSYAVIRLSIYLFKNGAPVSARFPLLLVPLKVSKMFMKSFDWALDVGIILSLVFVAAYGYGRYEIGKGKRKADKVAFPKGRLLMEFLIVFLLMGVVGYGILSKDIYDVIFVF